MNRDLTVTSIQPMEAGKGGEGGDRKVSNAEFITAAFPSLPEGAFAATCAKAGDPGKGGWIARRFDLSADSLSGETNNYVGCSSFYPCDDGAFKARKSQFAACHFIMLDDLGTKVPLVRLADFELSWLIETSPSNYQGGIIFAEPITDGDLAVRLLNALIDAGLCDAGATGPSSRWARLPVAINGKPKYLNDEGEAFKCRLVEWRPEFSYSPQEILDRLELKLPPVGRTISSTNINKGVTSSKVGGFSSIGYDVLTPKSVENPVVEALKLRGLYKTPLGSAKHDVTCPWVEEHTGREDGGSAYWEPSNLSPIGGFCCQHSHRDTYHIRELLEFLGVEFSSARHKAAIRVASGELDRVLAAAEQELANQGRHFQAGGLIVSVETNPVTGDPAIVPTSAPALTRELAVAATWERFDGRSQRWARIDPPARHVSILYDLQPYRYLLPLSGVVRQPYFRESDGVLIQEPGYDAGTGCFGVFDAQQFELPAPTLDAANDALSLLEDLLCEFHFVAPADKAAALSAIFTAVVRPTLAQAPAFHVRAPVMGSGKSYLCDLIGAFAGPGGNAKVSYPTTSEEATKVILSLLLTSPAVIEFDDMDTDWLPHGTIKRMLTAPHITDRILGVSKTATVSTRSLFLGSGNNVGPIRDLLRRVATIHLDPRSATPATMSYEGSPVDLVRRDRGGYVSAVLTIVRAWQEAGMPRAEVGNVVSFGGQWSDYCRYPLMWLGQPDPATSLIEQIHHDPDGDALLTLMIEWHNEFGSDAVTVRKAVGSAMFNENLQDAMLNLPVEERGGVNRSKLGWLLKKNANRIVGGYVFQPAQADGRNAWRVVVVETTPAPPSPSLPALPSRC